MFVLQTLHSYLEDRRIEVLGMTWTAPAAYLEQRNGGQALVPAHIDDFARFIASSIKYLHTNEVNLK